MEKLIFKPTGINVAMKQRSMLDFICKQLDDKIEDKITTNGQLGAAFADLYEYNVHPPSPSNSSYGEKYIAGYLQIDDHKLDLEIDPYMKWDDTRIFIGEKEITVELEPAELI